MNINTRYQEKYDDLLKKVDSAKKTGFDTKLYLFGEASFGLGVIKSKDGSIVNPILVSDQESPLNTVEESVQSGIYLLTMAFAALGADEILDSPKFEKCVLEAQEKIPLLVAYAKFKEELYKLDMESEDLN
jgi:hypothetical protein